MLAQTADDDLHGEVFEKHFLEVDRREKYRQVRACRRFTNLYTYTKCSVLTFGRARSNLGCAAWSLDFEEHDKVRACCRTWGLGIEDRSRANVAHTSTRLSNPASGLGFQVEVLDTFQVDRSSLGSSMQGRSFPRLLEASS